MKTETIKASVNFERGFYLLNFLIDDNFLFCDDDGISAEPMVSHYYEVLSFVENHRDHWKHTFGIPESAIESLEKQIADDMKTRFGLVIKPKPKPEPERYEPEISFDAIGRRVAEIVIALAALAAAVGALLCGKI